MIRKPPVCVAAVAIVMLPLTAGCLNPSLVNTYVGGVYPTAPGDVPFVQVVVQNKSIATIDTVVVQADVGATTPASYFMVDLGPGGDAWGTVFECPVLRVGLGDLDVGRTPAMVITFPNGSSTQIVSDVPVLVSGVNYKCGDTIVYVLSDSSTNASGVQISAGVVDGSNQTGPFQGADTFQTINALLFLNGLLGLSTATGT